MDDKARHEIEPGELCLDCGLCCQRPVFSHIDLKQEDKARFIRGQREDLAKSDRIDFPCPMNDGVACTIYEDRPSACRAWECRTLKRVRRGELELEEARAIVRRAVSFHRELTGMIPQGMPYVDAQKAVVDNTCPDTMTEEQFQKMRLASIRQETYLDTHIRWPGDGVLNRT